jgi:hypothetical protein
MRANALSYLALMKFKEASESSGLIDETVLWGGWARWFVTMNSVETLKDVDVILAPKACERFYVLALALRQKGFHPVWRIPDPELDKFLAAKGDLSQEPIGTESGIPNGHGLSWGLDPSLKAGDLRRFTTGLNLDLSFEPDDFSLLPGHSSWMHDRTGKQSDLLRMLEPWTGCRVVFENPFKTDIGLLCPSLDSQLKLLRLQLDKAASYGLSKQKLSENISRLLRAKERNK